MGKVIGSGNICIARLSDGYSNAVVMLYRSAESEEKPLRMLYNFSTGELSSGTDGKTLTECLNGWSTERGANSHYAISASVRSTEEYGAIESSSWSDSFLIAEKGETIVSVTLYQRAENAPEKPSSSVTYNFYTGAVTGSLGAWNTSIPDYTEYPLWSISATASAVLDGGTETDEINASEWSEPKKVAEDGKSPIEIFLSAYSYVFPADEDGIVKSSEYEKFSVEVLAVRGGKSVEFTMSAETTGISFITVSGNTVKASSSTAMTGDSASIKLNITAEGETYVKTISLAKAKQSKPTELWFAWSKSESIFTPKDSNFWIMGGSFIYYNSSLMGNIPFTNSWLSNWAEIEAAKTEEYCYLWCKTSESGTPFLFTGATGKTGACTMYQYALGDAEGNTPTDSDFSDTMPTIQGTGKMLWTRYKVIPAGGLAGDVEWSEAKLVGTDNSEVYARITDAETEISEITKSGGLIEQAITNYDSETGESIRSSITQTADKIAMKVGDSGTVTDKDGNTLAGITISDGRVVLQGDTVIEQGSLTGDTFTSTNLITGKTFKVNNGGAIQSANYEPYTVDSEGNVTEGKGFKLTGDTGVIESNEMILGSNITFGGIIENKAIKTVKEKTTGASYKTKAGSFDYYRGSDVYNLVVSNAQNLSKCVAENISSSAVLVSKGTSYYAVANISPADEVVISESTTTWTQTSSDNVYAEVVGNAFSFTVDYPCSVTITLDIPWLYTARDLGEGRYYKEWNTATSFLYCLDGGSFDSSITLGKHFASEEPTVNYSYSFSISFLTAGTHTIQIKTNSYRLWGDDYNTSFFKSSSLSYARSVTKRTTLSGYYAFITPFNYTSLSALYNSWSEYLNDVSCTSISTLTKYGKFAGLQRAEKGSSTYTDFTSSFSAIVENIIVGGVSKGNGVASFSGTSLVVSANGIVLANLSTGAYYSSYPEVSFTEIAEDVGTYVNGLFPMENEGSSIGSGTTQRFKDIRGKNLYSDVAEIGSSQKVVIGQDSESGYVNIYNVDQGSNAVLWHLDAWHNQLRFVRNGYTVSAYMDAEGVHGAFRGTVYGDVNYAGTSNSVYGCKFNATLLCHFTATGATTETLKYSMTNYQFITIYAYNQYSCGVYTFPVSLWSVWSTESTRLVLSTDTRYVGIYFPSTSSISVANLSPQHDIVVYGIK